jgi:hypothetical protein
VKRWWVSWYGKNGVFELYRPWWISGFRADDDADCFCAAIVARTREGAAKTVTDAHDNPDVCLEWRFIDEREGSWSPFCDRFPRADWMLWP